MHATYNVLILGASYGSLFATKLLVAGHAAKLVCLPAEAGLINREGVVVRMPVKGREGLVEINSRKLPGKVSANGPDDVDPSEYDLVASAMQEPQYRSAGVRELLDSVAKADIPCISIMNMPPLPYLERIPGISADACRHCYTDATVWDNFDARRVTLCSPDAQAFRPPDAKVNVLEVSLPTNFKAARFESAEDTGILRQLASDIEASRFDTGDGKIELPVKLKVHESVFVPLAKWAMLLAGNYRCVQDNGVRSIRDAVHSDLAASRAVYDWVVALCVSLGADEKDLVPFENTRAQRCRCRARRPPRVPWRRGPPTSSAPIAWCRPSRRRKACATRSSTRPLRRSTAGWSAIAGKWPRARRDAEFSAARAARGDRGDAADPQHHLLVLRALRLRDREAPAAAAAGARRGRPDPERARHLLGRLQQRLDAAHAAHAMGRDGADGLECSGWYLVNCNHQSWVDILALQHVLNRRIPMLKFFLKQQLIYVPVIGLAWWALDFPFMRRHSDAYLRAHPEKRHDDLEAAASPAEDSRSRRRA